MRSTFSAWSVPFIKTFFLLVILVSSTARAELDEESWQHPFIEPPAWQEEHIQLPAYPDPDHLLEVPVHSNNMPFTVYLDPDSISIGRDRVVRFTSVIVSGTGSRNITYEGLRCGERSFKRYAYGVNGTWKPLESGTWRRIRSGSMEEYRVVLYKEYMCHPHDTAYKPGDVVRKLKSGWSSMYDDL